MCNNNEQRRCSRDHCIATDFNTRKFTSELAATSLTVAVSTKCCSTPCYGRTPASTHYGITSVLVTASPTYSFQPGWVRVLVACRPSAVVPRRRLPSSVFWLSSSPCWHQKLCRFPNKHSVRRQKFLKLWSKNMERSAVCTQTSVLLCLNKILNPTCLMRCETKELRDSCFLGAV